MIYAFGFPLVLGVLPYFSLALFKAKKFPSAVARNLYNSGVATLTVGSIINGVLEIYGTTSYLTVYYTAAGIPLLIIGILIFLLKKNQA